MLISFVCSGSTMAMLRRMSELEESSYSRWSAERVSWKSGKSPKRDKDYIYTWTWSMTPNSNRHTRTTSHQPRVLKAVE